MTPIEIKLKTSNNESLVRYTIAESIEVPSPRDRELCRSQVVVQKTTKMPELVLEGEEWFNSLVRFCH